MSIDVPKKPLIFILLLLFFELFQYILRVSSSVILSEMSESFHIQAAGLGILSSAYYFTYVFMQIPAGILLDRFSQKKVASLACFIAGAGSLLMAHATNISIAIISRVFMAIGGSFSMLCCIKVARNTFEHRWFACAIGIVTTVATLGAVAGQSPWLWLTHHAQHWQHPYQYAGYTGVILAALLYIAPAQKFKISQDAVAFSPANMPKSLWLVFMQLGLICAPITAFIAFWGVSFFDQSWDIPRQEAANMMALGWVGGLLGGPILGWFADHFKKRILFLAFSGLIASIAMYFILYPPIHSNTLAMTLLFLLGFFCNANAIGFAIVPMLAPNIPIGFVSGLANTFNMITGPLFQLGIGFFLTAQETTHDKFLHTPAQWQNALIILPLLLFISSVVLAFYRINQSNPVISDQKCAVQT